jgi:hypothetical protein
MWPSDEERDIENREDLDSISKRPQNHKPELIHIKRRSRTEAVHHKVVEPRGMSSQVQEEQEEHGVCNALNSISCDKPYEAINSWLSKRSSLGYIGGIYTRNNSPRWVWD